MVRYLIWLGLSLIMSYRMEVGGRGRGVVIESWSVHFIECRRRDSFLMVNRWIVSAVVRFVWWGEGKRMVG